MSNDLVTTAWLAEHLTDDNLRIVDIRGRVIPASEPAPHYFSHHEEYQKSHIPGAVFMDWTSDIVEPGSSTYDVVNPERYAELMSQSGINDNTMVIAYDDANGMFASRLWWTLLYYGHSQVAVLDGEWQKWIAEGHPTNNELPEITTGTFTPKLDSTILAKRLDIENSNPQLLDVRSPAEFAGTSSRAQRMGHIPGAVNTPRKTLLSADGTLKSREELRKMFAELDITENSPDVVVYCNSGVSASYGLLALRAAGINSGRVYDSSWKEWGNEPDTPVETT